MKILLLMLSASVLTACGSSNKVFSEAQPEQDNLVETQNVKSTPEKEKEKEKEKDVEQTYEFLAGRNPCWDSMLMKPCPAKYYPISVQLEGGDTLLLQSETDGAMLKVSASLAKGGLQIVNIATVHAPQDASAPLGRVYKQIASQKSFVIPLDERPGQIGKGYFLIHPLLITTGN